MTRFLLSLDNAVDTIFALSKEPHLAKHTSRVFSARSQTSQALIGDRKNRNTNIGIRPGEKVHEILVSDEEASAPLTDGYYVIQPLLPELSPSGGIYLSLEGV